MSAPSRSRFIAILKAFENSDLTTSQLGKKLKLSRSSAFNWTKDLHAAKFLYITKWLDIQTPVYGWGRFQDAPRPRKLTNTERCGRYRRKKVLAAQKTVLFLFKPEHLPTKETARLVG